MSLFDSSFENLTRRLDINPASRNTTYDKSRGKGRKIGKVPTKLTIPSYVVDLLTNYPPEIWPGRIVRQYAFTAIADFRILNYLDISNNQNLTRFARLAVRWREANTAFRYALTPLRVDAAYGTDVWTSPYACDPLQGTPMYAGERIGAECVFEVWTHRFYGLIGSELKIPIGLLENVEVLTGLQSLPESYDQTEKTLDIQETLTDTDATFAKDAANETLPVDYSGAWNSN